MKWLAILLLTGTCITFADDIHKEFKSAPGKKLEMDIDSGGDIIIQGSDGNTIVVDVFFRGRDEDECKVDFDETSSGLTIRSSYHSRRGNHSHSPRFEVKVPKKCDLELESAGGKFDISDVEGTMEGSTMGGALALTRLKGKLNFHTMGGKITLTKSDVDGEVKTNGGKVLLEDVTGNVNGHSMGGNVEYRNVTDRSGSSTGEVVKISTMGGEIDVDAAPHGAEVSTMGGDIRIHSAGEYVKAKTMGGDISIDKVDGAIKAETMGGDVDVTMVGNPAEKNRDVYISSKGGDITLVVPAGLSMDVDIRLAYTKDSWHDSKSYRIESDFELKEERTNEWDDEYGSPRKYVTGKGKIGDGKHRIRVETINGNVYLKKGK